MALVNQETDYRWMNLALDQAKRGVGMTSPNPPVGAVLISKGKIIGQGYHRKAGQPHAEIEAINEAQMSNPKLVRGATLFVTLEPCCTQGRTGPCTEAIKACGIKRVVWGAQDPNPSHLGRAQEILSSAGISVTTGVMEADCREIIRPFAKWVTTKMPYVIAKVGQSLDGRITRPPGEGQWLTSKSARAHALRLRSRVDAIIVGAGTVRQDNPKLTMRDGGTADKEQPWRVILSRSCDLPETSHIFTDEHRNRTWVVRDLEFPEVLLALGRHGVVNVLVEGGSDVLGQAFRHRCVDEVYCYIAPLLCGSGLTTLGGLPLAQSVSLDHVDIMPIGDNVCISGHAVYAKTPDQS